MNQILIEMEDDIESGQDIHAAAQEALTVVQHDISEIHKSADDRLSKLEMLKVCAVRT